MNKIWFLLGFALICLIPLALAIDINSCQDLVANGNYKLTANVEAAKTCFNITGENIYLDCDGFITNYSMTATGYGINNSQGFNNITVKNCNITQQGTGSSFSPAIWFQGGGNYTFENMSIYVHAASSVGIGIRANDSIISDSIINTTLYDRSIHLYGRSNNFSVQNTNIFSAILGGNSIYGEGVARGGFINLTDSVLHNNLYLIDGFTCNSTNSTQKSVTLLTASVFNNHWYIDVAVNKTNGNPVTYADVMARNKDNERYFNESTNQLGMITRQTLLQYMKNTTNTYDKTNYTINSTDGITWSNTTEQVNLTINKIDSNKIQLWMPYTIKVNSVNFTTPVSETSFQLFSLNLSSDATSVIANFTYKGTTYFIASSNIKQHGDNWIINKTITIPVGTGDNGFKFSYYLTYSDDSTYSDSTSNYTQTVTSIDLNDNCATGHAVLNYTFKEEYNNTVVNGTMDMTVWFWYINGSKDNAKNVSFNLTTAQNSFQICANANFSADGYIIYTSGFQGRSYVQKSHWFLNLTLNTSAGINDSLYNLPSADSTSILLKILDEGYSPLSQHYVKVQRYYAESNLWRTVEVMKTDDNGYATAHLVEEDVDYKFIIQDYDSTLKTTNSMRIFCLETICTLEIRVFDEEDTYQYLYPDIEYSLYYVNATQKVTLDWNDVKGATTSMRLTVIAKTTRADATVCNTSLAATAGTLTCDLSARGEKSFYVKAYRGTSPEHLLNTMWVALTTTFKTFGNDGMIFATFLMITLALIGIWNPVVSIALIFAGFIGMMIFGIFHVTPIIIGLVAVIVLVVIKILNT